MTDKILSAEFIADMRECANSDGLITPTDEALLRFCDSSEAQRQRIEELTRERDDYKSRALHAEEYIQDSTTSGGAVRVELEEMIAERDTAIRERDEARAEEAAEHAALEQAIRERDALRADRDGWKNMCEADRAALGKATVENASLRADAEREYEALRVFGQKQLDQQAEKLAEAERDRDEAEAKACWYDASLAHRLAHAEGALLAARRDISEWVALARRQRDVLPMPDNNPVVPTMVGIDASARVLEKIRAYFAAKGDDESTEAVSQPSTGRASQDAGPPPESKAGQSPAASVEPPPTRACAIGGRIYVGGSVFTAPCTLSPDHDGTHSWEVIRTALDEPEKCGECGNG